MHDSSNAIRADSLYRVGKELSFWVRNGALMHVTRAYAKYPCFRKCSKLFGEDDEDSDETELEKAKADGEDGKHSRNG